MLKLLKVFLLLTALLFLALPAWAYDGKSEDIVVNGRATAEYQPDTAYVYYSLTGLAKTPEEAANQANLKAQAVEAALSQYAAQPLGELERSSYNLRPIYNDKNKIDNYQATRQIKFAVTDPAKAGLFIDLLLAAGVDRIDSVNFAVRNQEQLSRHLLQEAVRNAEDRGRLAATAGKRTLGRLLHLNVYNYPSVDTCRYYAKNVANEATTIEPTIQMEVQVEATFALE